MGMRCGSGCEYGCEVVGSVIGGEDVGCGSWVGDSSGGCAIKLDGTAIGGSEGGGVVELEGIGFRCIQTSKRQGNKQKFW